MKKFVLLCKLRWISSKLRQKNNTLHNLPVTVCKNSSIHQFGWWIRRQCHLRRLPPVPQAAETAALRPLAWLGRFVSSFIIFYHGRRTAKVRTAPTDRPRRAVTVTLRGTIDTLYWLTKLNRSNKLFNYPLTRPFRTPYFGKNWKAIAKLYRCQVCK